MAKLIMMCAPPGAGKSTYAMSLEGFTRISQDEQQAEHLDLFHEAIAEGKDIICDRMNFNKEQRNRYLKPAKEAGYETEIVVLHESYETCYNRMAVRVGHPTITDEKSRRGALKTFFTKYERVTDDEADVVARKWPDCEKPLAVVADLDGTLANCEHRLHFVQNGNKNWNNFFENMVSDEPNWWCKEIISRFKGHRQVVLCSGRPDNYRKHTEDWLKQYHIDYDNLFMRMEGDYRRDDITKEVILDFEILSRYTPYFFIDDRQQVVEKYRSRGYVVLQCAKGDF